MRCIVFFLSEVFKSCITFVLFYILEQQLGRPRQQFGEKKTSIYGNLPPEQVSEEDLCGPPVHCPECETCSASGVSLIDLISRWNIRKFGNIKYDADYLNRTTSEFKIECYLLLHHVTSSRPWLLSHLHATGIGAFGRERRCSGAEEENRTIF